MALVVDTTRVYQSAPEGYNFTWKLSKTLDQLSADDIQSQEAFVGYTSFAVNQLAEGALSQGAPENNPNHCYMWATTGYSYRWNGWDTAHWSTPANFPEGVYMRNILIYRPLNKGGNTSLTKALSDVRIVIDVEPDANTSIQKLAYAEGTNGPFISCWWNNDGNTENRLSDYCYISPATIIIVNGVLYLWTYGGLFWGTCYVNNNTLDQGYNSGFANFDNTPSYHSLSMGWTMAYTVSDNILTNVVQDDIYGNGHIDNVNYNGYSGKLNIYLSATNAQKRMRMGIVDTTENGYIGQMYRAFSGFRWKLNNVWYKPIIQGGIVTGYTDDMTVPSEWDNWSSAQGHNVPSGGGGGGTEGDDFDGMVTGFTNNIGGSAKYWLLPSDPSGLFEDFFLHAPQGSSITQNILSCYVSALNHSWQTTQHKMVIYTNGSQKPAFESQATYAYIYQSNPHKVLGTIEVPRITNTFYDFSPYTTYDVYVPFCGWIGLPDTVAGRTIRVYMDFDASICTCKARIECEANGENVIVGEISGTFGSPCPIQVTEGGLYRQAAINSALQIASGVASGTLGAATKHGGPLAIGGFSYALQGLTNAATAGNTNYSQTIGRSGDSSNLAGTSHYCYLRITHPELDEVVNNTRFGHTVGYLCNTIGKIGDFEGFTVCGNPHITGIACTESEKEEIKRMLEDGIIVNATD